MTQLKIDKNLFLLAFETQPFEVSIFLDKQTGELLSYMDDDGDYSDNDISHKEVEENPQRFLYIAPVAPFEAFAVMEAFVGSVSHPKARANLEKALSKRKPFRNFKDALAEYPGIEERWYSYQENHILQYAKNWLIEHDIQADLE